MCQYCGCHENTIIGRFADEHVRLINLSGEMLRAINTTDTGRAHDLDRPGTDVGGRRGLGRDISGHGVVRGQAAARHPGLRAAGWLAGAADWRVSFARRPPG